MMVLSRACTAFTVTPVTQVGSCEGCNGKVMLQEKIQVKPGALSPTLGQVILNRCSPSEDTSGSATTSSCGTCVSGINRVGAKG